MSVLMPIVIGLIAVSVLSLIPEPHRRRLNAVLVAGAGAAYLSGGGLGYWEFLLPVVMTYVAYRGLDSWTFIGVGWLLHTAWDVLHHLQGSPLLPFAETSSFGCAPASPCRTRFANDILEFGTSPPEDVWTRQPSVVNTSKSATSGSVPTATTSTSA